MRNKWGQENLERVQRMVLSGSTVDEIASTFSITASTLYTVMEKYDILTPRHSLCGMSLTDREKFLAVKLLPYGREVINYLPVPEYCQVTGVRLRYANGFGNTVTPFMHEGHLYIMCHTAAQILSYKPEIIRKVVDFLDSGL